MSWMNQLVKRRLSAMLTLAALPLAAIALLSPAPASAEVQFGTLSNFDVFNDTGEETHGFEIELDGVSSSDVTFTFGAPYQARYGTPKLVNFPGGVYVRYESPYDPGTKTFTQGTPVAPKPITPTAGHACWTGGSPGYLTAGCEHFGIGLAANPTNTVYRWLVADPTKPGNLIAAGTQVSLPAPEWKVKENPKPAEPPVVQAVIKAPEPGPNQEFGDAVWVKVFVTESPAPAILNHLVTDDPAVPEEPGQTETEWVLLQQEKGGANPAAELMSESQLKPGSESITRRYELYKYTGVYDEETHEARPVSESSPAPGDIGDYLGAQIAAANVGAPQPVDNTPPSVFIDSSPSSPTSQTSASFTFHATDPDNNTFTYFCSLDGAKSAPCTSPTAYAGLTDGTHTFRVEAVDAAGNASAPVSVTWVVDQPIAAQGQVLTGTEGAEASGTVATFTDTEVLASASQYAALIEWGDGTKSAGTITGLGGSFSVGGSHVYAEEGSYTVKVLITDLDEASNGATTTSTATIGDAPLKAGVLTLPASSAAGHPTNASFGFSDTNVGAASPDFPASINWGDGNTTTGAVTGAGGSFAVGGTHTYAATGSYTVRVTVLDKGGSSATASAGTRVVVQIGGTHNGPLVVKAGSPTALTPTAKVKGPLTVEPGGELEVEAGASVSGPLKSKGAKLLRLCGATISGPVEVINGTGPVVIGGPGCPGNTIRGPVTVTGNIAGTTVINNSVFGPLTVMGNAAPVKDTPNTVTGPKKLQ